MKKGAKRLNPHDLLEERLDKLQRNRDWGKFFIELIIFVAFSYIAFSLILGVALVHGNSMAPTLQEGEILLFYRLDRQYYTGDILIIHMDEDTEYVKRVVAMEADVVDFDEETGSLLVNGEVKEEAYINEKTFATSENITFPLEVGAGQLFVLGDNRGVSKDSREFGCISSSEVTGRVLFHAGRIF